MKSKRGAGFIGSIFLFIFFLLIYFLWLGSYLGELGAQIVADNSYSGTEAFFYSNLNLLVFVCFCLGLLGFWALGGSGV